MAADDNPPGAPTRRAVIGGLAALTGGLAGATLGPRRGAAATVSAPVRVGDIELMVVSDGTLAAPRAFALPQTPPAEVEALYRAHGAEAPPQFVSQTNATLAKIGGELILVDAGSGPNFQATAGRLSQNLEAAGIDPETIAKVVFTHGHADHLWGALDDFEDAERFPNASYVIPAAEWDFWTDPDTPGRLPDWLKGMARGSARVLRKIEPKVERRRPGEAVAAGLTYLDTAGHTPGHMAVMAESRGERLLVGGDALNNADRLVRPPGLAVRQRPRQGRRRRDPPDAARPARHRPHPAHRLPPALARHRPGRARRGGLSVRAALARTPSRRPLRKVFGAASRRLLALGPGSHSALHAPGKAVEGLARTPLPNGIGVRSLNSAFPDACNAAKRSGRRSGTQRKTRREAAPISPFAGFLVTAAPNVAFPRLSA